MIDLRVNVRAGLRERFEIAVDAGKVDRVELLDQGVPEALVDLIDREALAFVETWSSDKAVALDAVAAAYAPEIATALGVPDLSDRHPFRDPRRGPNERHPR